MLLLNVSQKVVMDFYEYLPNRVRQFHKYIPNVIECCKKLYVVPSSSVRILEVFIQTLVIKLMFTFA